ncbi:molybdate ABC transporter substrate-binding protein [Aeromicrobium fastidiosum]|uniref:Molybdate-binding protein ModA n=1 Tax=Aeromicrobium fastidiosum TaxID=52699 RepID=A0A641ALQ2_9ACTN|nr:molybdate ABC transporter substrate-binding protein [Aeromicrobium fastidiosum]KAA1378194.1 molybdate ABC transporter substrate-binding protein [Aeromicrobium fastidiosum]MBP2388998.1 molybdate transport system substrate-binding protein [Aeromicrobium fastidiosum]
MKRIMGLAAAALLLTTTVAACGSSDDASRGADAPKATTITVFAAASLKGAFTEIGAEFEKANPGVTVTFNFAGSADLVSQIQQGAPADVFASADTKNMDKATGDDLVDGTPADFATNTLEIATPPGNPAKIDSLDDLARKGVKVVLCAPEVPCGAAAVGVEQASGVDIAPVSEEQSVTDVLGKVISGEADAGLVYVTDVKAAGDQVVGVTFPESGDVVNTYPIASLAGSKSPEAARAFAEFVTGTKGQAVLAAAGFAKP